MFSAMLMICLANSPMEPNNCYHTTFKVYLPDLETCQNVVAGFYNNYRQNFEVYDEQRKDTWKIVNWQCVDWMGDNMGESI